MLANLHKLKPAEEEAPNSIIKKLPSIKSELEIITSPTPIKKSVSFKETEENKVNDDTNGFMKGCYDKNDNDDEINLKN